MSQIVIDKLIRASKHGDFAEVKHLVEEQHVDPQCRDSQLRATPLHFAAGNGHLNIVKYLAEERKCDLACEDKFGGTPLYTAAYGSSLDVVRYLVEGGCSPLSRNHQGRSPLHIACMSAHQDSSVVRFLIEDCKVDPLCQDAEGVPPLHLAAQSGSLAVVRYFIKVHQCEVMLKRRGGNTPLHDAASGGKLDVVQYLISEQGCDPTCKGFSDRTPLHFACQGGALDVIKYLLDDQKVDATCRDENCATPLILAAGFGTLSVVKCLVESYQCDVLCKNKHGNTPLHFAAMHGKGDIVRYLTNERGCDAMCRGQYDRTALHMTCSNGHLNVAKYLIDVHNVDPSCRDVDDVTPLHLASYNGHLQIVRLLIEDCLCDPAVKTKVGATPLDAAKTGVAEYLTSTMNVVSTDLRRALVAQLKPYTRKAKPTGIILGSGSFGSVVELISAGETVAGKVFKNISHSHMRPVLDKLCGELILMTQLNHTHIVQCKGVCFLVDQPLPVLLMERLMTSLHSYLLDPTHATLAITTKASFLCDVASGLAYLHNSCTQVIIHRDLTAKNVLLDSELRAKIADFGNSRIMDLDPEASPETFTSLPGTLEYMPPEAEGGSVMYDPSLDIFSFGHLALFTALQTPLQPILPRSYSDATGKMHVRSEIRRRQQFVDSASQLFGEKHSLVLLIKQCLHYHPAQRPRTEDLNTKMQKIVKEICNQGEDIIKEARVNILSQTPTISQLKVLRITEQKFEIVMNVAVKWKQVGAQLNFDPIGNYLNIIEADRGKEGVESCCQTMFQHWLKGSGEQPATWGKLLEVLKDCGFLVLASDLEKALKSRKPPSQPSPGLRRRIKMILSTYLCITVKQVEIKHTVKENRNSTKLES